MDLSERRWGHEVRHPWETARAHAVTTILQQHAVGVSRILDVGCGDGFAGRRVSNAFGAELIGYDPSLDGPLADDLSRQSPQYSFVRSVDAIQGPFDLFLFLDVIEHVEDDRAILRQYLDHASPGAMVMITVPAHQRLYSRHDRALGHFRRYSWPTLGATIAEAGLSVRQHGSLFSSLLLPRLLTKTIEGRTAPPESEQEGFDGIGNWSAPRLVTTAIEGVLRADNALLYALSQRGVPMPGLSLWALAER